MHLIPKGQSLIFFILDRVPQSEHFENFCGESSFYKVHHETYAVKYFVKESYCEKINFGIYSYIPYLYICLCQVIIY